MPSLPAYPLPRPVFQLGKFGFRPRDYDLRPAARDFPALAVDREPVAFTKLAPGEPDTAIIFIDLQTVASNQTGLAKLARHHRRVSGAPANHGENARGGVEPSNIVGRRLAPNQYDWRAVLGHAPGRVAIERDAAAGDSRGSGNRCRQRRRFTPQRRDARALQIDAFEPPQSLCRRYQPFADQIHGDPERGAWRAFGRAGLQKIQLAVFDRELDVLHILQFLLELPRRDGEIPGDIR